MAAPILFDGLDQAERIALGQLAQQPGYQILIRLVNAECARLNEAVIKLDPVADGYEKRLMAAQSEARAINKFSDAIFKSVDFHISTALVTAQNPSSESNEAGPPKPRFVLPIKKDK